MRQLFEHAACTDRAPNVAPDEHRARATSGQRIHSHSHSQTLKPINRPSQDKGSLRPAPSGMGKGFGQHSLDSKTADKAVGRWSGILQALGVDPKYLRNKHGPCPMCEGKDRYRFDDKGGRGTWFCSHCGSGDGFALLWKLYGWSFADAAKQVDQIVGTVHAGAVVRERTDENKLQALREVWKGSKSVTKGDPVWLYLNGRLGIDVIPPEIRFHPSLWHSDGSTHPAMLARMVYPDGESASIHRTYLTADGQKAPVSEVKKFMSTPEPLNSASVRLSVIGTRIGIAEGIETALAAACRFGVPVWAATNAALLESWVPPAGVKEVLIAGDNDASYAGQAAAFVLARRLVRDGYAVEIQIPDANGKDWADEMKGQTS